jgi:phospholipase C
MKPAVFKAVSSRFVRCAEHSATHFVSATHAKDKGLKGRCSTPYNVTANVLHRLEIYALKVFFVLLALVHIASAQLDTPEHIALAKAVSAPAANTPINHIIFLMQENHSFDNYFGTYPGADGIPEGTCMPVNPFDKTNTECIKPFRMGDGSVDLEDPDHSSKTAELQFNNGEMNGFYYALSRRNQDGRLAMGYYDDKDLPYYWNIADNYVLFDRFFSSAMGGSFVNHWYSLSATSDETHGRNLQEVLGELPTIFDRLQEKGLSWKFYVQNYDPNLTYRTVESYPANRQSQVVWVPLLAIDRFIDAPELNRHIVDLNEYYEDLADGTLPNVAYIVPSGPSEHPPSSLISGQRFVKTLIQSLMLSKYWTSSAFIWSYDDWGGWYDHVPPIKVDDYGYGFRVPALLVSSYAKQGYIDSTTLDYTSVLKFIEDNWDLEPLASRDANANSIVNAFDFSAPPREATFITFERQTTVVKAEPKRYIIYLFYSAGLVFALGVMGFAAWRSPLEAKAANAFGEV